MERQLPVGLYLHPSTRSPPDGRGGRWWFPQAGSRVGHGLRERGRQPAGRLATLLPLEVNGPGAIRSRLPMDDRGNGRASGASVPGYGEGNSMGTADSIARHPPQEGSGRSRRRRHRREWWTSHLIRLAVAQLTVSAEWRPTLRCARATSAASRVFREATGAGMVDVTRRHLVSL